MNKNDLKLIMIVLLVVIISFVCFSLFESKNNKRAVIYYENNIIETINLDINNNYEVDGYNGKVKIIVKDGKIKVDTEKSPLHLCSKQGYISKSYETIVCLPNKITIKIEANDEYDAIVE